MKKILCCVLALSMIVLTLAIGSVSAAADGETLTVKAGDQSVTLAVGEEVLLISRLTAGSERLMNCQGKVLFDSSLLEVDPVEGAYAGEAAPEYYSFPSVLRSSIICNYAATDAIYYNFSKSTGITVFNNTILYKFRFRAKAAGTVTLRSVIEFVMDDKQNRVYDDGFPNASINPSETLSLEKGLYLVGDANADKAFNIKDVTTVQKVCAGVNEPVAADAADANLDGKLSLADGLAIQNYLSDTKIENLQIGRWAFASGE